MGELGLGTEGGNHGRALKMGWFVRLGEVSGRHVAIVAAPRAQVPASQPAGSTHQRLHEVDLGGHIAAGRQQRAKQLSAAWVEEW